MSPAKWEAYLSLNRKVEADVTDDPASMAMFREFIATFRDFLPAATFERRSRVLVPGGMAEAALLAEAGYEVHALVLGAANLRWLEDARLNLKDPELLTAREQDAHDLDYPSDFFDGYFSIQTHEHLLAPLVHIGEVRACSRAGAVVFVDACGTTNEACKASWHTNLVSEQAVREQWNFWGFSERWRGPHGDGRPQFVFEMLPIGHPNFENSAAFEHLMVARNAASA